MSVRDEKDKNTANDTAKVLSSVFDVIFLIAHEGQLVLYNDELAVFSEITNVKDIADEEDALSILKLIKTAKKKINVKDIRIKIADKSLGIDWADVYIARDDKGGALFLALKDITEGQRRIERLSEAGIFDPLTGAYYRSKLRRF